MMMTNSQKGSPTYNVTFQKSECAVLQYVYPLFKKKKKKKKREKSRDATVTNRSPLEQKPALKNLPVYHFTRETVIGAYA